MKKVKLYRVVSEGEKTERMELGYFLFKKDAVKEMERENNRLPTPSQDDTGFPVQARIIEESFTKEEVEKMINDYFLHCVSEDDYWAIDSELQQERCLRIDAQAEIAELRKKISARNKLIKALRQGHK